MRLVTFTLPTRRIEVLPDKIIFRHDWRGNDTFWIVPMIYVAQMGLKGDLWTVSILPRYFEPRLVAA